MSSNNQTVVGVDACSGGWFATRLEREQMSTDFFEIFKELTSTYSETAQILVDIPIGFPEGTRRQCNGAARDFLGSRGNSVFFPPCRTATECDEYEQANEEHRNQIGHGLSMQAYSIGDKILEVNNAVVQGLVSLVMAMPSFVQYAW